MGKYRRRAIRLQLSTEYLIQRECSTDWESGYQAQFPPNLCSSGGANTKQIKGGPGPQNLLERPRKRREMGVLELARDWLAPGVQATGLVARASPFSLYSTATAPHSRVARAMRSHLRSSSEMTDNLRSGKSRQFWMRGSGTGR